MKTLSSDIIKKIVDVAGKNNVLFTKEEKIPYKNDASYIQGLLPELVIMPENADQIASVLKICSSNGVNVTVRSGGTALTGSSVLQYPGILINTMKMDKILDLNLSSRYVVCQPGVRLDKLNEYLKKYNFFYPPDPASSRASTVGGSISTNAGGLRAVKYGATKEWVLGAEFVTGNGNIITTGEYTLKRSAGYDITALLIGSEGTLGVLTKAILKIEPLPEESGRILSFFRDISEVGMAISDVKNAGITPLIAEFMDLQTVDSIRDRMNIDIPEYTQFLLMIDIDSTKKSLNDKMIQAEEIIKKYSSDIIVITDKGKMDEIYNARKGAYSSLLKQRENDKQIVIIGDLIVPASELPDTMKEIRRKIDEHKIKATLFGHIGDGNIHANIFAENTVDGMKIVDELQMEIARIAISHRGCVSAEHGIGTEKNILLYEEYRKKNSLYTLELMKNIKNVFDPENIMNRGKIFYEKQD